jgi:hypothetical protein
MTKTFSFTARKIAPNTYAVREEGMLPGRYFGEVTLCDAYGTSLWVFVSNIEELSGAVEASESLREVLAEVRAVYVDYDKGQRSMAEAEQWAESAWLRAAEYNAEHQWEMDREHMMGLT